MSSAGSGYAVPALYGTHDILDLVQSGAAGGQIAVTGVDGSGRITSFVVLNPGTGYSLGACTTMGGSGTGAAFTVSALTGGAGPVQSIGYPIPAAGTGYSPGDVLTLVQSGASGATVTIMATGIGGAVLDYTLNSVGTGYFSGNAITTGGHGTGAIFPLVAGANVYTENPVLCIADYLADLTWGYKYQYGTDVPLAMLQTNATVCDTTAPLAVGGTEPLYACNGQFNSDQSRGEVLQDMLTSCAGRISAEPPFTIQPGYWTGATVSPTDLQAIAAGPYQWYGPTVHELFNCVRGIYISPNNRWMRTDYPPYAQDAAHGYSGPSIYAGDINLALDNGERRVLELNLPFTISCRQAQYTAKVKMLQGRWANLGVPPNPAGPTPGAICGGYGRFACNMAAFEFGVFDVFKATVGFLGISGQFVEVVRTILKHEQA